MAYTGTGSQADPAIPNTITELYDIFDDARSSNVNGNTSGPYYVKLTKNIDCADDENYIGYKGKMWMGAGQNNRVCLMYSDNNNYIRGLTVKDAYFIDNTGETTSSRSFIQNISFIDCFFKPPSDSTSNSSMVFRIGNNGGGFINCTFSISMFPFTYGTTRFVNITLQEMTSNGCSYYFKYNGNFPLTSKNGVGTDYLVRFNYALESNNNVFIFEGGYIRSAYNANYYLISSNKQKSYNAFIFKNTQIESGSTIYVLGSTSSYSYVAFINPSLSSDSLANIYNVTSGLTCCMIGTDKWSEVFTKPEPETQNVMYYPTLNELKSSDYLLEKGFIP